MGQQRCYDIFSILLPHRLTSALAGETLNSVGAVREEEELAAPTWARRANLLVQLNPCDLSIFHRKSIHGADYIGIGDEFHN